MVTELTACYPRIVSELPGCPTPLVAQVLLDVIREFCTESQCWQEEVDAINIQEDVDEYDLDVSGAEIIMPVRVTLNDGDLDPELDYVMSERTVLKLVATPDADDLAALEVRVALRPCLVPTPATTICTRLFSDWHEAWEAGTKARLMAQPDKAWTNIAQSNYWAKIYWTRIGQARVDVNRGGTPLQVQIKARYPFAV